MGDDDSAEPPPEAAVIEQRRATLGMSIADAAKTASMSESRWRQITKGFQQATPDTRIPVTAPARTLARMARAVGVTAEQLDTAGRTDAADILRAPPPENLGAALARLIPHQPAPPADQLDETARLWRRITELDAAIADDPALRPLSDRVVIAAADVLTTLLLSAGAGTEARPLLDDMYHRAAQAAVDSGHEIQPLHAAAREETDPKIDG
jgi:hypothetical protein